MEIIKVNKDNLHLIYTFLEKEFSQKFRYFKSRKIEDVIDNHLLTIIGCIDSEPMCYGHLDKENDKIWLGICIIDKFQGKGYGKEIMKYLLSYSSCKIYLSVDNDNIRAINLYKKFNFVIDKVEKVTYMNLSFESFVKLPVSYGEAMDKLSILDIKIYKIKDDRVLDVKKEYNVIYEDIKDLFNDNINYHYKILKNINLKIWEMQDEFRESKNINLKNKLCIDIIEDNDRRFRIKSKINSLCNSSLKEQKGYVKKKAFVLTHLGLGDNINTIGLVRYLSTCYDETLVVCKKIHRKNMEMFYNDDNSIKLYFVENDCDISPSMGCSKELFNQITFGYDLFLSGYHRSIINKTPNSFTDLPFNFYKDSDINPGYFWDYFHIPEIKESMEYYNYVKDTPYIVMNNTTSVGVLFNIENIENKFGNKNDILYIDLNKNVYESTHKFYEIAQKYVGIPLLYYTEVIKNASKIILSDSSILCMSLHLDIKTDKCYYISRDNKDYSYLYNFENLTNIKKFKFLL